MKLGYNTPPLAAPNSALCHTRGGGYLVACAGMTTGGAFSCDYPALAPITTRLIELTMIMEG